MLLENVGRKSWDGLVVGDVEDCRVYVAFRAILLDKLFEVLLSASTNDDAGTGLDELY